MTDQQLLALLLSAEQSLKKTTVAYTPTGPNWKSGMDKLWKARQNASTADGVKLATAHGLLKQVEKGYDPHAPRWSKAMLLIDGVEEALSKPPIPNLGPCCQGDKSVLLHAPTHNTDGIQDLPEQPSVYSAYDTGWVAGKKVLAPERLKITKQSSASGADAFYAVGISTIGYWFGHIVSSPATETWFDKGETIGRIASIATRYGGPHLHIGLNTIKLIGHDLKWGKNGNGPDYTFGSPTIGVQLTRALAT